jgi:HEAT repeat protein
MSSQGSRPGCLVWLLVMATIVLLPAAVLRSLDEGTIYNGTIGALLGMLGALFGIRLVARLRSRRPPPAPDPERAFTKVGRSLCLAVLGQEPPVQEARLHRGRKRPTLMASDTGVLLTGLHQGSFVQISLQSDEAGMLELRVETGPEGTSLTAPRHGDSKSSASWSLPIVETGDAVFDAKVKMMGAETEVLAVATEAWRAGLMEAVSPFWRSLAVRVRPPTARLVSAMRKSIGQIESGPFDATEIRRAIGPLSEMLKSMGDVPGEALATVARNALADGCAGVRKRCLDHLVDIAPDQDVTRNVCRAATNDRAPVVRLSAAVGLGGEEGFDLLYELLTSQETSLDLRLLALRRLAKSFPAHEERGFAVLSKILVTEEIDGELRILALRRFAEGYPPDKGWPIFESALASAPSVFRDRIFHAVASTRRDDWVRSLCSFARRCSVSDSRSVIRAIAGTGGPDVEPTLIELLHHSHNLVRGAAIGAIGDVGTAVAIEPLAALAQDLDLGDLVRDSLRRIRERTNVGGYGRVSLAAPDANAGAVSLAGQEGTAELCPKDTPPPIR